MSSSVSFQLFSSRAGDQICSECGLVVGDRWVGQGKGSLIDVWINKRVIDVGSEWRSFSNGDNGKEAEK